MPSNISIGDPISSALNRTGEVLFRPFNFGKWMAISLGAGLTLLGESWPGMRFANYASRGGPGGGPGFTFDDAMNWIRDNLLVILIVATVIIIVLFFFYLLFRWLNCRGQFMFYDNIVNNDSRVKVPWNDFREIANSLLKFRILWDLLYFNVFLILLIITGALIWPDASRALVENEYHLTGWTIGAIIFAAVSIPLALIALWISSSVIFDMAVPVMYIRRTTAWPTIKHTWTELFRPNMGPCLLFFLMMIVVRMVQGLWAVIAILAVVLITCCMAYCFLIIPGINLYFTAFVALPVLTFERAFKLHFISQFGEDYRVHWQSNFQGGFPVILNDPIPPPETPGI